MNTRKREEQKKGKRNRIMIYLFYLALPFFMLLLFKTLKAEPIVYDDIVETEIDLPTIVCDKCVHAVKNALGNDEAVVSLKINLETRKALVSFHNLKTSISKLEKLITKAGYDANNRKANKRAFNNLPECCKKK